MKANLHWVEESVLEEGAFLLLASTSVNRYAQTAKSLANTSALKDHFKSGLLSLEQLIDRARELHHQIARKACREIEEVELAIVLAIIAEAASEKVSALLVEFSLSDNGALVWTSALSRKLYQERANNIVASLKATEAPIHPDRTLSGSGIRGRVNLPTTQNAVNAQRFSVAGDFLLIFRSDLSDAADQLDRPVYA
jgi:hypothetical protein